MQWSKQQEAIFDWFANGTGNAVVDAKAGAGKTSTVRHALRLAPETNKLYVVYNARNAAEAKSKITDGTKVLSLHGLGLGFIKSKWSDAIPDDKVEIDRIKKLGKFSFKTMKGLVDLVNYIKSVSPFADKPSLTKYVAQKGIKFKDATWLTPEKIAETVIRAMETAKSKDHLNRISFADMIWLPVVNGWVFRAYDLLVVDESQDLCMTQVYLITKAVKENGRMCLIGDPSQCVISGTLIDTPAGEVPVETRPSLITAGQGAGKIKTSRVTNVRTSFVTDEDVVTIKTASGNELTTTLGHTVFADYDQNSDSLPNNFVYLMRRGGDFRIGITSGYRTASSGGSKIGYIQRCAQETADAVWILEVCDNTADAQYWEQYYSVTYGIPTWIFPSLHEKARLAVTTNEHSIKLFKNINTEQNVKRLMKDRFLFEELPHHVPKCMSSRRRRNFNIALCGDSRENRVYHRYSLSGSDLDDAQALIDVGLNVRKAKSNGWRLEACSSSMSEVARTIEKVKEALGDVNVIETASLDGNGSLSYMPASHVRKGMFVFVLRDNKVTRDLVTSVEYSKYTGEVHDLNTDALHNYSANGIMVHNCIYSFRGASGGIMAKLGEKLNAKQFPLTTSYRCSRAVIEAAQVFVPSIEARPDAPEGSVSSCHGHEVVDLADYNSAILSFLNAPLVPYCLEFIRVGKRARISGKDIGAGLVYIVNSLRKTNKDAFLEDLEQWFTQKMISASDEKAMEAILDQKKVLEYLAEHQPPSQIDKTIQSLFSDDLKDCVVLSSVHKSKGLEWDRVFVLKKTLSGFDKPLDDTDAQHLCYVAITRAKNHLTWII
jgi:hypothetical protein